MLLRKRYATRTKKIQSGFSMVELITTLIIITILSSVTIVGYRQSRERLLLHNEARKILVDLRRAQSDSLSGIDFPLCVYSGSKKLGRIGMYFSVASDADRRQYIKFVDKSDTYHCDGGCATTCNNLAGERIEAISTTDTTLLGAATGAADTAFTPMRAGVPGINNVSWSMVFIAPDPTIKICRGSYLVTSANCDYDMLELTFYSKSGMSASITVYTSGRVDANF